MMGQRSANGSSRTGWTVWRAAPLHALAVVAAMFSLFSYRFALADRYTIFLYHHDMGPLVPDTSPFSRVTSSRYWMAGLVASGAVLVLYGAANWLVVATVAAGLTRLRKNLKGWSLRWLPRAPAGVKGRRKEVQTENRLYNQPFGQI